MLLLGIDLGTSAVKVSVVDAQSRKCIASAHFPETETDIYVPQPGWAEQNPDTWWEFVQKAILKCHATKLYQPAEIGAIGIAYQMHGLVVVDKNQKVLRNAIIWCDSRAVAIGESAFSDIGSRYCLPHLLNSPGNFTASKLAWVKQNEQAVFEKIDKWMLPGDFISMQLTGEITTTSSALSEGICWDFISDDVSETVMQYFGFDNELIPAVQPLFSSHGSLLHSVAEQLSLPAGIPVTYKAGDQLNNAFSLNVLQPGEVAATAGTSGVIYGVSEQLIHDPQSRINSFAHVNHTGREHRIGVLLCINGAGIFNRWIKNMLGSHQSYDSLNTLAMQVSAGADGLFMLPFGNGSERMLHNRIIGSHIHHIDVNQHAAGHMVRAAQEGIAFSFRYGLDIMKEMGMHARIIRAGRANMFLSDVFTQAFVNVTGVPVALYDTDGSVGAALGAGTGMGVYHDPSDAFAGREPIQVVEPTQEKLYNNLFQTWKSILNTHLLTKQPAAEKTIA